MAKSKKITVDLTKVAELVSDGKDLFLTPDAEKAIVELFALKDQIEAAIEELKGTLAAAGEEYNPDFTSIKADSVRVSYRQYGGKYAVDDSHAADIPEGLVEPKVSYKVLTKEIDAWVDEHGGLPLGINERERAKTISISIKK